MESTRSYIDAVKSNQWQGSTPCSEWDVKQVANHIIGENLWAAELFKGKTIGEVGNRLDGDLTGGDPAAACATSVGAATPAVSAPGWDIAKATGQDSRLDLELVQACLPIAEQLTTQFRSAGVFGENLAVDAGADPQTKLLALVGRPA